MRCLIETLRRGGVTEARDIDTERLSLGSGTDQDIRLQSRRAGLRHAVIQQRHDGKLYIRAIAPNNFVHNGKHLVKSVLMPGDELSIGSICFTVGQVPEAYDLRLVIKEPAGRQSKELEDALLVSCKPESRVSGFSVRRAAWSLSLAIMIIFFLVPVAGFIYKPLGIWLHTLPMISDLSWNSGPISSAHSFFAADCNRCHEQAFVPVQNSACAACHKDTPHHFDPELYDADALKSNRCASCHKEHSGSEVLALASHDDILCASCHENIKATVPDSKLPNVSDFGNNHPEFQATISTFADDKSKLIRIPIDQKNRLQERANIEFSHAVHLKKEGVKRADQSNVQLTCANCHQPEPGGKYMTKLDFESQCHSCHRLNFEAEDPKHELPHGDDQAIQKYLEGYYAARALKGGFRNLSAPQVVRERQRPGETITQSEQLEIREWAAKYASDVNYEVMRYRVCGKCHIVNLKLESNLKQAWKIQPLGLSKLKFPKADFDHDKHKTQDCKNCHDAEKSEHSEDVLLKGISSCRACHGGASVTSSTYL